MEREDFIKVAEETLDSLPEEFRIHIQNVAILVEDFPANQRPPKLGEETKAKTETNQTASHAASSKGKQKNPLAGSQMSATNAVPFDLPFPSGTNYYT